MSRVTFETEVPTAVAVTQSPNTTKFQLQQRLKLTAYAPFCWNNADKKNRRPWQDEALPGRDEINPGGMRRDYFHPGIPG